MGEIRNNYDWLIVGAGIFGAVFANEMMKAGKKVLVVERRKEVGGNIRCEKYNGVLMHKYGAHIFHTNKQWIWDYVNEKAHLTPIVHSPMAKTGSGKFLSLPFCLQTFHGLWPDITTPQQARDRINEQTAKWRERYPSPSNLEEKALTMVGSDVFEELIRGYTEKQWNAKCSELPAEIISRIPLRFTWQASYFDDAFVGVPKDGYNPLIETLLDGADIITGVDFLENRAEFSGIAKRILYTGCIDEYYGYSLGHLNYRSLQFDTKIEPLSDSQGCSVVNYTGNDVPFTRCIEHNQFSPSEYYEELVKSYEYPIDYKPGRTEPYYPIINEGNKRLYDLYAGLSLNSNVFFGGRLGLYEYMDMDDAIEISVKMANRLK